MYEWQATWTPDTDSPEERRVRFEADYDRLGDADVLTNAYRATRRENVVDEYALTRYWKLADLTGTYAKIADTLGEQTYPDLTAWLEDRPEVLAVRPRTPVVDVLLDSTEDGRRLRSALRDWLGAEVSATVERTTTRKPGANGAVGQVPRLQLRTQFHLDETVERHAAD
ncbi:hypothetical protein M0R88_06140 [Halorussus gelatinilyticus]|uniref:Uncharacterized protein n=1 Tax=Halorussus gelatinilyticus TaxID=2937524 RepID=A0A8U0ILN8_9EURY|nr:hypothetical protein [Halorussus gelatinilyticus]UPW01678.1 hypothetical protein M0R88_06140 [Halorussus gelatinilyticus]